MISNPVRELAFRQLTCGEVKHVDYTLSVGRYQFKAVEREEQFHRHKRCTFVAINKRMVA